MMISVVLCKINEKNKLFVNFLRPRGPDLSIFDCAIDRQNYREIVTKVRGYRCYAWNI